MGKDTDFVDLPCVVRPCRKMIFVKASFNKVTRSNINPTRMSLSSTKVDSWYLANLCKQSADYHPIMAKGTGIQEGHLGNYLEVIKLLRRVF